MTMDLQQDSCAIVVTFKPDITALLKLLGQLNKETEFVVIDNGSADIKKLMESISVYKNCKNIICLERNRGLAKALNIGIDWALSNGAKYAFLFDQDSSLCDLFVSRMISAFLDAHKKANKELAAVGPRIINPQTMRQTRFKTFSSVIFRSDRIFPESTSHYMADFLITSGTMLNLDCIKEIGFMKESYFIDNVDLEWCFRAKSKGFDLVGTDEAVLYHAIGERSKNPLVRSGIMAQHNPARTYYSSRNRVHLYAADYSPIGWKVRDLVRFTFKSLWLILTSSERRAYLRHISSGIRDAKTLI